MAAEAAPRRGTLAEPPTLELVLKRNNVERLKREKSPLGILDELPDLIATGYEDIPEEDMVRFQWYGLYHDKPKLGYFMLRIKMPGGILTPARPAPSASSRSTFGRDYRRAHDPPDVQLHWLALPASQVFAALEEVGLTTAGGCGDAVRNITGCPVAGLDPRRAVRRPPVLDEVTAFFIGHRDYSDLPRKHKITIADLPAPVQRAGDQLHRPRRRASSDGRSGFACGVGGGLSSMPRIAATSGSSSRRTRRSTCCEAILDVWRTDLQLPPVARQGAPQVHGRRLRAGSAARRSSRSGSAASSRTARSRRARTARTDHLGIHPQKHDGLVYDRLPGPSSA